MERGGGAERCLIREPKTPPDKKLTGAGLLHYAVLADSPELIRLLWPYLKKCVRPSAVR